MYLKRKYVRHIVRTFAPCFLLVLVSWISYFIDPKVVPGRMALLITTLLMLINISNSVSEDVPPSSEQSAVQYWVNSCLIWVGLALLEYALVLWHMRLFSSGQLKNGKTDGGDMKKVKIERPTLKLDILNGDYKLIDKIAFLLSVTSFIIFTMYFVNEKT